MPFVEFLASYHNRAGFDCGKEPLNRFIREIAKQNADRNLGVTQVIVPEAGSSEIIAYYTLVTRTVETQSLPERSLPRGEVGVILLGRLAVDLRYQGQGIGKRILLRAMADTANAAKRLGYLPSCSMRSMTKPGTGILVSISVSKR